MSHPEEPFGAYASGGWQWEELTGDGDRIPDTESAALVEVGGTPVLVGGYFEGEDEDEASGGDAEDDAEDDETLSLSSFCLASRRWRRCRAAGVPNREGLAAVSLGDTAILHGGTDPDYDTLATALLLTVGSDGLPAVQALPTVDSATAGPHRTRHAGCPAGTQRAAFFGGMDEHDSDTNTLFFLAASPDGAWRWEVCTPQSAAPPPRHNTAADATAGGLAVVGGAYQTDSGDLLSHDDVWVFSAATAAWREVRVSGVPKPLLCRNGHLCAALPGDVLAVLCGAPGAAAGGGETGSYDPGVVLVDLAGGGAVRTLPAGEGPVDRYMPAGTLLGGQGGGGVCRFFLATGTKRVPGSNNPFLLSVAVGQ